MTDLVPHHAVASQTVEAFVVHGQFSIFLVYNSLRQALALITPSMLQCARLRILIRTRRRSFSVFSFALNTSTSFCDVASTLLPHAKAVKRSLRVSSTQVLFSRSFNSLSRSFWDSGERTGRTSTSSLDLEPAILAPDISRGGRERSR